MSMPNERIPDRTGNPDLHRPRSTAAGRVFALTALLLAAACGSGNAGADQTGSAAAGSAAATDAATAFSALGASYVAEPIPGIVTAAQPTPEQAAELRALGYERFMSLRPESEPGAGWEESEFFGTEARFTRIPISGAGDLSRENVEALDRVLAEAEGEKTVLYCASSNRVGALMALRAYWLQGADAEDALELGREAGLTSLEPAVRDLIAGGG